MKKIFRSLFVNFFSFLAISFCLSSVEYSQNITVLLLASLTLSLTQIFVKPILNLLFLPLNFITFGTFKWVISILLIYLTTIIVPQFQITSFFFPGKEFYGFVIPSMNVGVFGSYLIAAFLLELISGIIYSIFK